MNVTVICDASFCPETGASGWACWVACDRGRNGHDDQFTKLLTNNTESEMKAIVNAIYFGMRENLIEPGDSLLLQTDCQSAIDAFTGSRTLIPDCERESVKVLGKLMVEQQLKYTFRHVKGHTNRPEPRFATNRSCDKRAKKHMRIRRTNVETNKARELINAD